MFFLWAWVVGGWPSNKCKSKEHRGQTTLRSFWGRSESAVDWIFVCPLPSNSCVVLTPERRSRRWGLGRWLGHEVPYEWEEWPYHRAPRDLSCFSNMCGPSKKMPPMSPKVGCHQTSNLLAAPPWISSLQNWKNNCFLFQPPSLWHFCYSIPNKLTVPWHLGSSIYLPFYLINTWIEILLFLL